MEDILETLAAARLADAEERRRLIPFDRMEALALAAPPPLDFAAALKRSGTANIIAELKRASPSEGTIREDFRPAALAAELARSGAAALSVLCEPHRFLGSEEYLKEAKAAAPGVPVLYKDFIVSEYQLAAARAAGADAALLIAAVLDDKALGRLLGYARSLGLAALVETHDRNEIERAIAADARIVGVNCRNLRNFSTDVSLLESLIAQIPSGAVRVAESGMHTNSDVAKAKAAGADAFLVGTALMRAPSPGDALKSLIAI